MPSNFSMKNTALVGKNKGSSTLKFQEVDSLGVPLLPTAVDVFGNKGGVVYEAPFIKTSMDSDKTSIEKITDETGTRITTTFGDRERILSGEFLGNYEELAYDNKGATVALSTPYGTKTAGVVTLTVASHTYTVGEYVNVFGAGAAAATALSYNGLHKITAVTATTITYNFGTDTPAALTSGTIGDAAVTIASCSKTAGVVTVTTAAAHNRVVGQLVRIAFTGADSALYNGVHVITSVPTATTYTYTYGTDTDAAAATGGTQHTAMYLSLETLLTSGQAGKQFKVWYYAPVKTPVLSTDVGYNKYIYWIGRFNPEYEDKRDAASSKSVPFTYTPEILTTAITDQVGGQIFTKIRVPSIPAATAVDLAELQVQSST